jgi:hypothetical protein
LSLRVHTGPRPTPLDEKHGILRLSGAANGYFLVRSDSDAANPLTSAPIKEVAASLSLLAMTAKGLADGSPVIMRTAARLAQSHCEAGGYEAISRGGVAM